MNVDKVLFCSQIDIFNFLLIVKYLRSLNETEYEMLYVVRRADVNLVFVSGCRIRRLCISPLS